PVGSQIEWTKDDGARHLTEAACASAKLLSAPPVDRTETAEERVRIMRLLLTASWRVAKTMPQILTSTCSGKRGRTLMISRGRSITSGGSGIAVGSGARITRTTISAST